jgi:hypothetical protein
VIRNLLGPEPLKPLAVIEDFNLYVSAAAVSPDGVYFVVEGLSGTAEERVRSIRVYKGTSGEPYWTIPSQQPPDDRGSFVGFDPSGRYLCVATLRNGPYTLFDLSTRSVVGQQPPRWQPAALGPGAARWLEGQDDARGRSGAQFVGLGLFERGQSQPLVTFLGDGMESRDARFRPDGLSIAWGHFDGTVSVCDLVEINRRLWELDLGW